MKKSKIETTAWPMRLCEAWLNGGAEGFVKMVDVLIKSRETAIDFYKREKQWLIDVGVHDEVVKLFRQKFEKDKNK